MAPANPLTNKVALITGASGGMGQSIARRLAAEGASVALAYGSNAEPARQLADALAYLTSQVVSPRRRDVSALSPRPSTRVPPAAAPAR